MNDPAILKAQLRAVGLIVGGLCIISFVAPRFRSLPGGLQRRKMPPPQLVWDDAAHEAEKAQDIDLLIAFARSKIPEAQKAAAHQLCQRQLEPSEKLFAIWAEELASPDQEVQYVGALSIYKAARKLKYKSRDLPLMPGWKPFQKDPQTHITTWREWWRENRGTLIEKCTGAPRPPATATDKTEATAKAPKASLP